MWPVLPCWTTQIIEYFHPCSTVLKGRPVLLSWVEVKGQVTLLYSGGGFHTEFLSTYAYKVSVCMWGLESLQLLFPAESSPYRAGKLLEV